VSLEASRKRALPARIISDSSLHHTVSGRFCSGATSKGRTAAWDIRLAERSAAPSVTDADISEGFPIRNFEEFPDVRGFSEKPGCSLELSAVDD
jgi:hypothetical protein